MQKELKLQWRRFGLLALEHSARNALLRLFEQGDLQFQAARLLQETREGQSSFLERETIPYFCTGIRQSQEFFEHAFDSSLMIKPLLYYYGSMSLVKSLILLGYPDFFLERKRLLHGLSLPTPNPTTLHHALDEISVRLHTEGIFPTAHKLLHDSTVPDAFEIPLSDMVTRLLDMRVVSQAILKREPACLWFGNCVRPVHGKSPQHYYVDVSLPPEYVEALRDKFPKWQDDFLIHECENGTQFKSRKEWTQLNDPDLRLLLNEYFDFDPTEGPWLPRPLKSAQNSQTVFMREVELLYLAIFAFGSLARYHPNLWAGLNSGKQNLLSVVVGDLIDVFETKFLGAVNAQLDRFDILFI